VTGFLSVTIESRVDKSCGLLNQPTGSRQGEARRMRESVVDPCHVTRWSLVPGLDVREETNLIEIQVDLHFETRARDRIT